MKDFLRAQLERYTQRLAELDFLLSREDIMKDMNAFMALSRERTEVGAVAERYQQHQQRQADAQAAQLLPNLGLFAEGGYGQANLSNFGVTLRGCCGATHIPLVQNQQADWAAGLRLNWRLFDGGISAGQVAASRAGAERLSLASARERNRIRQELETAFFDHEASLAQVLAARAAYRAAREALRDARARYGIGLADYTDVSDSLRELTVAMEAKAEAITLANLSYARLLRELTLEPPATSS